MAPDTFCILPWSHLYVDAAGCALMCCHAKGPISHEDGTPVSIYQHTIDEIRNSSYMIEARRKMVAGEALAACQDCYDHESRDSISERTTQTSKCLAATKESAESVKARAIDDGYKVSSPPSSFHLLLGNVCNLACRMCYAGNSSRIEEDPVHGKWAVAQPMLYWVNDSATIGPVMPFGIAHSGFNEHELIFSADLLGRTNGRATVSLPLDPSDEIVAIELEFVDGPAAQLGLVIAINQRTAFRRSARRLPDDSHRRRVVVDTSRLNLGSRLSIGIVSWTWNPRPRLASLPITRIVLRRRTTTRRRELVITRFDDRRRAWADQDDVLFGEVLTDPRRLQWLNVTGGEPLLHKRFLDALKYLADRGCSEQLELTLNTNCTTLTEEIIERLERFPKLRIALSLDGCGPAYEYIRYPAVWANVFENAKALKARLKTRVFAVPIVQAYNIMTIVDMMRLFDSIDLHFALIPLTIPEYLSMAVLPRSALDAAAAAISQYAETAYPDEARRAYFRTFIEYLENVKPRPDLRGVFMEFTNDLDRSRGQSFCRTYPDLVRHFAADGTPWDLSKGRFLLTPVPAEISTACVPVDAPP